MATLLEIYNGALQAVGEETLIAIDDAVEARLHLDQVWDRGAREHCLKLSRPDFSRKTAILTTTASGGGIHDYSHALPADLLAIPRDSEGQLMLFASVDLDQPITRHLREGRVILSDSATAVAHYVSDIETAADFSTEFIEVLVAYLARQIAPRIAPDRMADLDQRLSLAIQTCSRLGDEQAMSYMRPQKSDATINNDWLLIYRDALQLMGLSRMKGTTSDTEARVALDDARSGGAILSLLDDAGWSWALSSVKIDAATDIEPEWGHSCVFVKPTDMARLHGVFSDERLRDAYREYRDEGDHIFADINGLFLTYVPTTLADSPGSWPPYFKKYAAAELAKLAGSAMNLDAGRFGYILGEHKKREDEARNVDAMVSPPRIIRAGSWVRARVGNASRRDGGYSI